MKTEAEENYKNVLVVLLLLVLMFMGVLLVLVAYSLRIQTNSNFAQKSLKDVNKQDYVIKKNPSPVDTQILDKYSSDLLNVVVNKKYRLSSEYIPPNLVSFEGYPVRSDMVEHLKNLLADAKKNNTPLQIVSGYRSYDSQRTLYNEYVRIYSQVETDRFSARPGHSEHQTGLAVDLSSDQCLLTDCFGETEAGIWLAENAHNYGFIVRYPKTKEKITGYMYEPWHLRFVGLFEAGFIVASNLTLDEMYDVPAEDYLP